MFGFCYQTMALINTSLVRAVEQHRRMAQTENMITLRGGSSLPTIKEASRMAEVEFSPIRKVFEAARKLEAQGKEVINLGIGRPDFDTPLHIKEAAKAALDKGFVHYTSNYGDAALLKAIADKLKKDNGIDVDASDEIVVTVGASEAVFGAMMSFINPGDEVIIPTPSWINYPYCTNMAGATPIEVPLRIENGFVLDPDDVAERITSRTKMIVITNPHNPTGAVIDQERLLEIGRLAEKHNLIVLSDEIYEKLVYDDTKVFSLASAPGIRERVITVGGFSKAYSMTGWRIGYVAAPRELIRVMIRIHQYATTCATSFAQKGAVAALTSSQDCVKSMVQEFDRRRKLIVSRLNEIPGFRCPLPKGAFYCFPSIEKLGLSSQEVSDYLLHECLVASVPGGAFGKAGEGFMRFSYANSYENISVAMDRIAERIGDIR